MFDELVRGLQTMPRQGKPLADRLARVLELQRKFNADPDSLTPEENEELLLVELGVLAAKSGRCICNAGPGSHRPECPLYPRR